MISFLKRIWNYFFNKQQAIEEQATYEIKTLLLFLTQGMQKFVGGITDNEERLRPIDDIANEVKYIDVSNTDVEFQMSVKDLQYVIEFTLNMSIPEIEGFSGMVSEVVSRKIRYKIWVNESVDIFKLIRQIEDELHKRNFRKVKYIEETQPKLSDVDFFKLRLKKE